MIKMYINNEEVVSNKEFTISEEMLATPSTVLNNCYPALWENTKDYVSKFYFPKDYSKCIIGDGEFEKGSQRNIIKKVSGVSPSFETNITKPWESLTIDGNSYQATSTDPVSPSPDYPSEIENIKGENLWDDTKATFSLCDFNSDTGIYSARDGDTKSKLVFKMQQYDANRKYIPGTEIVVEAVPGRINFSKVIVKNCKYIRFANNGESKEFSIFSPLPDDVKIGDPITLSVNVIDTTVGASKFKEFQLEKGSVVTRYVPYGNIQIVETGKNLLDNKNPNYIAKATWQSTETNYEPYIEEVVNIDLKGNELCSLPNGTKDELIVKNGRAKINKKFGEYVFTGNESFAGEIKNGLFCVNTKIQNMLSLPNRNINQMNSHFFSSTKNVVGGCFNYFTYLYMFPKSDITSTDEFKVWLKAQYDAGTPVKVQYELETPEEIDLGEVTLPNTLIGQNNVTLDATLETNMEISYYYSSYDLLFAGVVKKTGNISLNPRYPHYADIQVLDFKTFLSEGETLNFVIDNKTIGQAIDMVIDAIKSYGFVKGNIMLDNIDEVIGAYSTDKKTAYDVFQYFSDITNSRWFTRMIDEDTVAIDFYDTDKLPVKPKIEYTEDWFCNNLIDDMSYSIKTDDYRNKQILLSDEVFGSTPYNDLLTSNGYDTSYTTTGKIASLTSAKIDGKDATFTTEANKEGGVEADIYYKPGEVGITTNNQIGAGKVIEITYIPLVEGREIIINDEEVNRIGSQLNRNGVISRYENRNDTTSSDELRQIGQTYIKYKGKAEVTLKITSRKNIYDIGDKVQFDAPLEDLSTEYMVKKKTTKYIVTANQLFYDYELSSSFNSESEINYFDNQRSKHKGNLSEGDYITRDIDITNSANIIWHDTSIDEISITGNNILDCALDSPFTD